MLQRNFRRKLVKQLIQTSGENSAAHVGRQAPRILERLTGRHLLDRLEEGGKSLHRQGFVCEPAEREMLPPMRSGEKRPSRCGHMTSYKCKQCNVPLCIIPCFEIYHTKQEHILAYKRMKITSEVKSKLFLKCVCLNIKFDIILSKLSYPVHVNYVPVSVF